MHANLICIVHVCHISLEVIICLPKSSHGCREYLNGMQYMISPAGCGVAPWSRESSAEAQGSLSLPWEGVTSALETHCMNNT